MFATVDGEYEEDSFYLNFCKSSGPLDGGSSDDGWLLRLHFPVRRHIVSLSEINWLQRFCYFKNIEQDNIGNLKTEKNKDSKEKIYVYVSVFTVWVWVRVCD